jgi:CO/xanthine dehydrogenase Mo-binding subunit
MLHARFLTCPHPRARITDVDLSIASRMPGVAHILTYKNAPALASSNRDAPAPVVTTPNGNRLVPPALPRDMNLQGEVVAIVAADTEDQAEDAIATIRVEAKIASVRVNAQGCYRAGARRTCAAARHNLIRT